MNDDILIDLGFNKDNVAYHKYVYNNIKPFFSLDFSYFYITNNRAFRVFLNDWSNWFDVKNENDVIFIYNFYKEYYKDYIYSAYTSVDRNELELLGFIKNSDYSDLYYKDFDNFLIEILYGYRLTVRQKNRKHGWNYEYVATIDDVKTFINFYNKILNNNDNE